MNNFVDKINVVNDFVNGIVWGPIMIAVIIFTGLFLTVRFGFIQLVNIKSIWNNTVKKVFVKTEDKNKLATAEAALVSMGEIVGSGNIAGVATAIVGGGPGALVWMWIAALIGMATKFAEIVLGILFKKVNKDGSVNGGPMYYLRDGVGSKFLAGMYAFLCMCSYIVIVAMVDTNTIVNAVTSKFDVPNWGIALALMIIVGFVIFGGVKRLGGFSKLVVPIMGIFYIIIGLIVIFSNIGMAGNAFATILTSAFRPQAAVGGFAGATVTQIMRYGFARGIYSNEAGLGTAAFPHAAAETDSPIRQGLWGPVEVFCDTIIVNTITGVVVVMAGLWTAGDDGAALAMSSFGKLLPFSFGDILIMIAAILFSFTCLTSASYVCERACEYLFGEKAKPVVKVLWLGFIAIGAMLSLDLVWNLADTVNGLMLIPNLIGLLVLSKKVADMKKEFFIKEKVEKLDK